MTTTIDFDALQAAQGPKVILVPSTTVSQAGGGDVFTDFSVFSRVYVTAKASLRVGNRGQPSLTILVEHSDDGESWSTAATLSYGPDGARSASVSSPKEFFRVSWSVGGSSEWQIVSVEAAPTYLDAPASPGGSQPVSVATVPISSAELLDLHNNGKTLVAAPGEGKLLLILQTYWQYTKGTVAYAGGPLTFECWDDTSVAISALGIDQVDNSTYTILPQFPADANDWTPAFAVNNTSRENRPFTLENFDTPLTLGDGTVAVTVVYATPDAA